MPGTRLELAQPLGYGTLNTARLPISPSGHFCENIVDVTTTSNKLNEIEKLDKEIYMQSMKFHEFTSERSRLS